MAEWSLTEQYGRHHSHVTSLEQVVHDHVRVIGIRLGHVAKKTIVVRVTSAESGEWRHVNVSYTPATADGWQQSA